MGGQLSGRVMVVTGATGIAAAGARALAAQGADVFIVSLDPGPCEELAAELADGGARCAWAAADLRDEAATVAAFQRCRDTLGQVDGLFAVAGGSGRSFGDGPLHELPLEGWRATFERNADPMFLAAREAVRAMLARPGTAPPGAVVLVSSVLARHPSPRLFATHAYAAAKGAALALTRTLAAYYAGSGIRVNAVAPGLVRTPMAERAASDPTTMRYAERKQPLVGGFLPPESVAEVAAFLLSDPARYLTGQVIEVDGGWGVTEAHV